ncbi:MAG: hypothetical protein HOI95_25115 [Chromatiales bacterium]|nr:hypothetical protein [Chromatiales bacterium]
MQRECWRFGIQRKELDNDGFGQMVLSAHTANHTYSLVGFSHYLAPEQRTDRVIAEAWDATFNLIDGVPDAADLERLAANTPKQELGRFSAKELVLARANKSVRLFEHTVECLSRGLQPDPQLVGEVGYLMRTTAVYGNGKFGCSDRSRICDRPEFRGAFHVELLAVYMIRWFTIELIEHLARAQGGAKASRLGAQTKRYLGIGNATGLGMAPFLVTHPTLLHRWVEIKELALERSLAAPSPAPVCDRFVRLCKRAGRHLDQWNVADAEQTERIGTAKRELDSVVAWLDSQGKNVAPLGRRLFAFAASLSLESQELLTALILETHGSLVDDLSEQLYADVEPGLDTSMSVGQLLSIAEEHYSWLATIDFESQHENKYFWYYSDEKFEPRLGDRQTTPGAHLEMPLAVARDASRFIAQLQTHEPETSVGEVLMIDPTYRHIAARMQCIATHSYGEIRDNLIGKQMRPIDLLRFKLAFFGACKFDPKSDLWTRIALYQGAPTVQDNGIEDIDDWGFPEWSSAAAE